MRALLLGDRGDARQAVVYLLRRDRLDARGRIAATEATSGRVTVPGLEDGPRRVTAFDPEAGRVVSSTVAEAAGGILHISPPPWRAELALAVSPAC